MREDYEADLKALFQNAENILGQAEERVQDLYSRNGLEWSREAIRGLKGDVYAKVLGKYLEEKTGKKAQYEVKITKSGKKADILLNERVAIESKAMGIFDMPALEERWESINRERPDLKHLLVGWEHDPPWVKKIRKIIGKEHHFMFYDRQAKKCQPHELERLVNSVRAILVR